MEGKKSDLIFLIDGLFIKEVKRTEKEKKIRADNSMATGTLKVKAKPRSKPALKRLLRLPGLYIRRASIVGKSIKISALAILPSIKGILERTKNKKDDKMEFLEDRYLRHSL